MKIIIVLAVLGMASASLHSDYLRKVRSLTSSFENAMDKKIRAVAQGNTEVEEALSGLKKRYVEAFNEALVGNHRLVRQALTSNRYVSQETVKRSYNDMESRVHFQATRGMSDIWGNIKDKFNDFTDWASAVLGDIWSQIEPSLIEVRDLAQQLIKDGARQLSEKAKLEAIAFFKRNSDKLTEYLKEKLTAALSGEKQATDITLQERDIKEIWGNIKDNFNDFGDWTKQFFGDIWADLKPNLIEVRDMAVQLIKDKGKYLSDVAKEQALKFFQANADKLTKDLEEKITGVLGTGETQLERRDIWGSIKDKFNDFGDWAKQFFIDIWEEVEPSLIEVRDMAMTLIKDGARQLTTHAKDQALKFFQKNADKLTKDLEDKITDALGTGEKEVDLQERGFKEIWGNIKDTFNDFGDYVKQFFGDIWADVQPNLIEVRDMATQLIKDKGRYLTTHAKEQALKFFQTNADKLTEDLEEKITKVLGGEEQGA
ncbi:uncharacterized protein LOC135487122 [Lineus longissimus]|uniref:uncharacterized protein LOC135487122 n=1 Tax=Lineus longissimus TaxID=88925 RepID=UPI002B4F840A